MLDDGEFPVFGANGIIGKFDKYNHENPEVLITCRGATCGSVNVSLPNSWINGNAMVVRPKSDSISKKYLEYFARGAIDYRKVITGAAQPQITRATLSPVEFSYPTSTEEQKRIVGVLDEAFAGIDAAIAHTQQNLTNARELFESYLNNIFTQKGEDWVDGKLANIGGEIKTGPFGSLLHKSDYIYNGTPLVNPSHIIEGKIMPDIRKTVSDNALDNLNSYLLKEGDVVIGRRGDMGRCAAVTNQENGWLCGTGCFIIRPKNGNNAEFLSLLLQSNHYVREITNLASGATMLNLSNKALGQLKISVPSAQMQAVILKQIDEATVDKQKLSQLYTQKLTALKELKQSLLQKAFAGELTASNIVDTTTPKYTAEILAFAFDKHEGKRRDRTFGHVKAQKILHLVEAVGGMDLGRTPKKDAAGPNDFQHMLDAEEWAEDSQFFKFEKRGEGYKFVKLSQFSTLLAAAKKNLKSKQAKLNKVINLLLPMDSSQAEIIATVHAAWNNLLLDGKEINDEAIVFEARDNWHPDKMKINRDKFFTALGTIRQKGITPKGVGQYVGGQETLI